MNTTRQLPLLEKDSLPFSSILAINANQKESTNHLCTPTDGKTAFTALYGFDSYSTSCFTSPFH